MVLVQVAWFVAVADRRSLLPLFCSCPDPASMSAPACQLFEFRARKIRYDPSKAILERAPLNLLIALTPQRFEMVRGHLCITIWAIQTRLLWGELGITVRTFGVPWWLRDEDQRCRWRNNLQAGGDRSMGVDRAILGFSGDSTSLSKTWMSSLIHLAKEKVWPGKRFEEKGVLAGERH